MNFRHQTHAPQLGFTLVEVLVAAAILATGLLGAATMITRSTLQDSRAYYTTKASMLMEEYLENATRIQYDSTAYKAFKTTGNFTKIETIDGIKYSMQCGVSSNEPLAKLNTIQSTCTISWNNKGIQSSTQYVYVFSPKY
ncbi:prepilin-type N-terminal cleavage/methylation domain-containing protein [Candidatus Saccharibacteria bacterium]|nr:prepilin-type N-terminal cleavage/methylation domain-containing protein [Candidatus Saccharibacteria bacterium]